jgi:hypothetical protein
MTKFVGSSRVREGGRPVTHYQDFISHTGGTDWRHEAAQIDMSPSILGGSNVQSAIQNLLGLVFDSGTGFISIGSLDGYSGFYAAGKYNVNSVETPTLKDAVNAAVNDDRLVNGGVILLLPGYYRVSDTITIPNGISLIGEGPGVYIIGETSGDNPIFNIASMPTDFSINGDSGSGDQDLILGTGVKKTTFKNLIITDNSDGYVNSGNSTLSSSGMILVDRGSNVDFEKVTFIGRLNDGPVLNRLKTASAIFTLSVGLARGTSINVDGCYFDGFKNSVSFRPQLGSSDNLSIINSKIKFYGEETASYSINDCAILSSLASIKIENNFFLGAGSYSETILGIFSDSVSNPTDCSVAIVGNSGYSIGNTSRLCDNAYTLPVRSTMHSNAFGAGKDGNKPWTIVLGMDEGDILGEGGLDLILSTYSSLSEVPTKIILNPGNYSLTVNSGTFSSLKLEGNPIGKKYPTINLNLSGTTSILGNNKFIYFGNIENIYFNSINEVQLIVVTSQVNDSDVIGENVIVNNCIFKDTGLYLDERGSDNSTNSTGAWDGSATRMQAFISKCRFYQSGLFNEDWSLIIGRVNTIKLSDSYFHGSGYALIFKDSESYTANFTIDACTFDISGASITSAPVYDNPYYINISSRDTKLNIKNSAFISSTNGDSVANIISVPTASFFINIRASDVNIESCYFNTPSDTYLDTISYPMSGLYLQWVNTINLSNNVFNSGALPIKIGINDPNLASIASQNYCNISNNKISLIDSNYFTILDFDVDLDGTDSINRFVNIESNYFSNSINSSTLGFPQHLFVTGGNYNTFAAIQLYALGADVVFSNNYVFSGPATIPVSSSFTYYSGVYINSYDSTNGKSSLVTLNNNSIDAQIKFLTPANSSQYSSAVHVKSNYININNNKINANNTGASASPGFKGCLVLDCLGRSSAGDSIIVNNIFDRTSSSGSLSSLERGYILITPTTNIRGQIVDNSFVSPYISGTTTTLLEDNTSAANNWIFARNKNQTVSLSSMGSIGQIGLRNGTAGTGNNLFTVSGLTGGSTATTSDVVFRNDASVPTGQAALAYRDTANTISMLWSVPLSVIIPPGAYLVELEAEVEVSGTLASDNITGRLQLSNTSTNYFDPVTVVASGVQYPLSLVAPADFPIGTIRTDNTGTSGPWFVELFLQVYNNNNLTCYVNFLQVTYRY